MNFLLIDLLTLCAAGYYYPRQIMVSVLVAVSKVWYCCPFNYLKGHRSWCRSSYQCQRYCCPLINFSVMILDDSPSYIRFHITRQLYLAGYLFYRVLKRGHDARFDEMRSNFWAFLGFWVFQMLWAWGVSLPVLFINSDGANPAMGGWDWAGLALFVIGFFFEVRAGLQWWRRGQKCGRQGGQSIEIDRSLRRPFRYGYRLLGTSRRMPSGQTRRIGRSS